MKLYNHISKKERQKIEFLLTNNYSIRNIAKELSRSPSTISREINRNRIDIDNSSNNNNSNSNNNNNNNNNNNSSNSSNNKNSNNNNINNNNKDNNNNNNNNNNNKYSWFEAQCRSKNIRFKDINNSNKIQKYPELQNYIIDKLNKKWSPEQISGRLKLERSDMYVSYGTIYSYIVLEGIYNHSEGIKPLTLDRGIEFLRPQEIKEHNITPYYCDPMRPGQKGGVENKVGGTCACTMSRACRPTAVCCRAESEGAKKTRWAGHVLAQCHELVLWQTSV